jgi:hypothetical protein
VVVFGSSFYPKKYTFMTLVFRHVNRYSCTGETPPPDIFFVIFNISVLFIKGVALFGGVDISGGHL